MSLILSTTDLSVNEKTTALIYGGNGTGKTTFAASWPNPVFLVPWIARNEMKSLAGSKLLVAYFRNLRELQEQVQGIGKAVEEKALCCDTLVVDNLTAMQVMLKDEMLGKSGKAKFDWDDWDKFANITTSMMNAFHKLPPHVLWITHEKIIKEDEETNKGSYTLQGSTRDIIPGFADMILHATVTDLKAAGLKYKLYLKGHDIWTCRMRAERKMAESLPQFIEDPSYDKLAALLGWKSCAEIEGTAEKDVK
jgi:hypothetical protein